ncbi:MAG: hypothetical protein AAF810_06960 [Cyanobacteria bacterium P01_D01_bin.36]
MTQPDASTAAAKPQSIDWKWFLTGCSCLALGSIYLQSVDLGNGLNTVEGPALEQANELEKMAEQPLPR